MILFYELVTPMIFLKGCYDIGIGDTVMYHMVGVKVVKGKVVAEGHDEFDDPRKKFLVVEWERPDLPIAKRRSAELRSSLILLQEPNDVLKGLL